MVNWTLGLTGLGGQFLQYGVDWFTKTNPPTNYVYTPQQTVGGDTFGGYYSYSAVNPEQTIYAVDTSTGVIPVGDNIGAGIAAAGQSIGTGFQQAASTVSQIGEKAAGAAGAGFAGGIGGLVLIGLLALSLRGK